MTDPRGHFASVRSRPLTQPPFLGRIRLFGRRGRVGFALLISLLVPVSGPVPAADVTLLGVFPDRVLVEIAGERRVLVVGETAVPGLRLQATDTRNRRAWLEIAGQSREMAVGDVTDHPVGRPAGRELRVYRDSSGEWTASGGIDGHAVRFRVDPDTPLVIIGAAEARRLGIDRGSGRWITLPSPSGLLFGRAVTLGRVQLGTIVLEQVDAVVLQEETARLPVLGRSFLGRLQVRDEQGSLLLTAPH